MKASRAGWARIDLHPFGGVITVRIKRSGALDFVDLDHLTAAELEAWQRWDECVEDWEAFGDVPWPRRRESSNVLSAAAWSDVQGGAHRPDRRALVDLTGQRFEAWEVLELAPVQRRYGRRWTCRCDCDPDTTHEIDQKCLLEGRSRGCRRCAYTRRRRA